MQPIDPEDPRRPYIKVAASIRAAILAGDLEPGTQLPTGDQLAETFGVSRNTIINATRLLRDEGFVTTTPGGGSWVQDQAQLPAGHEDHPLTAVASYIFELGFLKNTPRTGWNMLGIPQPESVAEHSFRTTAIGIALAVMEGADIGHTTALCVLHDTAETRISDIASVSRAYLIATRPEKVAIDQTAGMPDKVRETYRNLIAEFEAAETLEAKCAKDADKLELLAQAREYERQGYDTAEWQQTSLEALRTKSGQWLGQAIMTTSPVWWKAFADSYHEIKREAKSRGK
jgi:5'-deoxynucleotidase YfbR-like HD superfamily hydrolase